MDKDCVLILSGGMDSTTMLHEYAGRIALAVSFDYGSNHNAREIEYARMNCEITGVEHIVIPLTFMAGISIRLCSKVPTKYQTGIMPKTI